MDNDKLITYHQTRREEAAQIYKSDLSPVQDGPAWTLEVNRSVNEVEATLTATRNLNNIQHALEISGAHSYVLRFLMGPPLSQDQFKIACPEWVKSTEKSNKPLKPQAAKQVSDAFRKWADRERVEPILLGESIEDRNEAIASTAHMMAVDRFRTNRRMRLSGVQEFSVKNLLERLGYRLIASCLIDQPGMLGEDEFMCATQFETADGSTHEVDVAIGLPKRGILALECKVSNDSTNSVKRINDVLKKASAWKARWGLNVQTAALLQGVFSPKEPRRLLEAEVEVFWSHHLQDLEEWLLAHKN